MGIYVASRASVPARPQMWRSLRAQGWPIVSTWIDEAGEGETGDFAELWQRIESEITASSGVVLYAEESDFPLKGAFIECGMALGMGKPVAVVLKFPLIDRSMKPLGSWANHPLVKLCQSLDQARRYVESVPARPQPPADVNVAGETAGGRLGEPCPDEKCEGGRTYNTDHTRSAPCSACSGQGQVFDWVCGLHDSCGTCGGSGATALARSASQPPAPASRSGDAGGEALRASMRDAVAQAMDGLYTCGRVWSAWGYGTMSQDDFAPAGEDDDVVENVVDAALAAIASHALNATLAATSGATSAAKVEVPNCASAMFDQAREGTEADILRAENARLRRELDEMKSDEGWRLNPDRMGS